ncbi:MAG: CinA family protein [Halobacteriota archaeon]|nr:CinA family protein [Halobacteriota archaeon]
MYEGIEEKIGELLREKKLTIAIAESCTGGLISHRITDVPGSSDYFEGSVISYSNEVKMKLLGVLEDTLKEFGAVSSGCAVEMAEGIRDLLRTDIGLSATGIAGPGGATPEKPIGLVYIALSSRAETNWRRFNFKGNREENKESSSVEALRMVEEFLTGADE